MKIHRDECRRHRERLFAEALAKYEASQH